MSTVGMRDMLEAGVHFGHQAGRWNPLMKPYIWGAKNGVHIINLQKTVRLYKDATDFVSRLAQRGEHILFVGTKRQAQEVMVQEASRGKLPYVNHRWLGGMLTNFRTIKTSIDRLDAVEKQLDVGNVERLTKKEVIRLERERDKLLKNLGGIRHMGKIPGAVFIVDTVKEHIAVHEANKLKIPIVALIDTNSDPSKVDYPIPSNDDAIRAIRLFSRGLVDAYLSGAALNKESFIREMAPSAATEAPVDVIVRTGTEEKAATEAPAETAAEAPAETAAEAPAETAAEAPAETPAEAPVEAPAEAPAGEAAASTEDTKDA